MILLTAELADILLLPHYDFESPYIRAVTVLVGIAQLLVVQSVNQDHCFHYSFLASNAL